MKREMVGFRSFSRNGLIKNRKYVQKYTYIYDGRERERERCLMEVYVMSRKVCKDVREKMPNME